MKKMYKYIFVILVYRNTDDLKDCIDSIKSMVKSYKIVVVNAFFDDDTKNRCESIAVTNDCDFLNIENKGYSFGNNRGIEFALNQYDFKYLIVANPDTEILKFEDKSIDNEQYDIFAPDIITLRGTQQNPMGIKRLKLSQKILYKGFKNNNILYVHGVILFIKIVRTLRVFLNKLRKLSVYPIYCAHGSFVIMRKESIEKLYPVYDENMFLFAEEGVLAAKADRLGLKTCYYNSISIKHKEDGSMKLSDLSINQMLRDANIYYYEHYEK